MLGLTEPHVENLVGTRCKGGGQPALRRATQPEIITWSAHLYEYCSSRPLALVDPLGYDGINIPHVEKELKEIHRILKENGYPEISKGGAGLWWLLIANRAVRESKAFGGLPGNPSQPHGSKDALRHCMWMCIMSRIIAKDLGAEKGKDVARQIAEAHERIGLEDKYETEEGAAMDRKNNEIGLNCPPELKCVECCLRAIRSGQLFFKLGEEFGNHRCPNATHPNGSPVTPGEPECDDDERGAGGDGDGG